MSYDWKAVSAEEASQILFMKCTELILNGKGHNLTADVTIRVLTQRLYGDYRQVHNTSEYKRAEKHVFFFKNTGLGKELF